MSEGTFVTARRGASVTIRNSRIGCQQPISSSEAHVSRAVPLLVVSVTHRRFLHSSAPCSTE
jgi:hypothetical protein